MTTTTPTALVRAARPRQWTKNLLVLAAPVAAGVVSLPALLDCLVALLAFCLAASGVYLLNDVRDVASDRAHSVKQLRPVASGEVSVRSATVAGLTLMVAAAGLASVASMALVVVIMVYLAVQVAYSMGLKNQPVLDISIVASGFLLRGIAGGAAADIGLSQWFLLVTAFGSLFMVSGKRYAELRHTEGDGVDVRRVLGGYTPSYLRFVWTLSATAAVLSYCLWAFELHATSGSGWAVVSVVPFTVAVLRFAVDVDGGQAGEPEDIALRDRVLQMLAVAWLISLLVSAYG